MFIEYKTWVVVEADSKKDALASVNTDHIDEWPWFGVVNSVYTKKDAKVLPIKSSEAQKIITTALENVLSVIGTNGLEIPISDILTRLGISYINNGDDTTLTVRPIDIKAEEIQKLDDFISNISKSLSLLSDITSGMLWYSLDNPGQEIISSFSNPYDLLFNDGVGMYMVEVYYKI